MGRSFAAWAISISDGTLALNAYLRDEGVAKSEARRGPSALPASLLALRYSLSCYSLPKDPHRIRRRDLAELLELESPHLGHATGHVDHPGRLVALAAMRRRRQVRRVGLHQEPVERHPADLVVPEPALE